MGIVRRDNIQSTLYAEGTERNLKMCPLSAFVIHILVQIINFIQELETVIVIKATRDLFIISHANVLTMSVPDESYSRNASCALN